jgi:uncharacterized protein (DUF1800 family)
MANAAIALNRFGLGARWNDSAPERPQKWLIDQLALYDAAPPMIAALPKTAELVEALQAYRMDRREIRNARKAAAANPDMSAADGEKLDASRKQVRNQYADAANARLLSALESDTPFAERLVHFWSNHFAVSIDKLPVTALAGNYEFAAIRPHIMGKFSDLLSAAVHHPAMLIYLDQAQSIGPGSVLARRVAARRNKELGLNENLAREILELHTLGVRTGYDQADVTEFAKALTGNSVAGMGNGALQKLLLGDARPGDAVFVDAIHEPGARRIMGKAYAQDGAKQGAAILADLAVHPATARHVAAKLAQHFVADTPPEALVRKLETNFLKTGGDLPSLYRTLVEAPEAWGRQQAKFKSPWEWVTSSLRALNVGELPGNAQAVGLFTQLGQPVWKPGSPAGFADTTAEWAGGSALMRRVEIADRLAQRSANKVDARELAPRILPDILSTPTSEAIARAESLAQGLALLLMSPEFLRR